MNLNENCKNYHLGVLEERERIINILFDSPYISALAFEELRVIFIISEEKT